jgi:anti-sigma factor RsiW
VNHSKVRARLNEYLERDLPTREFDRVSKHLAECTECRAELRDLEATVGLLRRLPDPELPPAFTETVMARVRAGEAEPAGALVWLRRLTEPARALPMALATLALAVGIGTWRDPEAVEVPTVVASAQADRAVAEARQNRLRQIEHLNQLMREGRHDQVARMLRGAGHPHSASLARHIETGTTIVLASHSPGR